MQISSDSGGGHLVDISGAIRRSLVRGSIQLPILALNHSRAWTLSGCEREAVNFFENTFSADLVHAAYAPSQSAVRKRAIKIAIAGLDQI